ncbi:transmembrane protease serine 9 [Pyrenophora seminiperda CCB06]|uniref:Transmembrane protease serine 9 n=1 Tax=Pyrenophora seminiperda CCB06 TaxID=1302712 RepID=A0A3M7M1H5_9PLEO|nr:transmembrane protease serine 9 [Pyrenophora seminiperda CCB06]
MVDVAVTSQLSQWTFAKPDVVARPLRASTDSSASSPNLCDDVPETLRIGSAATPESSPPAGKDNTVLQKRYLSSEEDLTADDGSDSDSEYDYEDVVVHDLTKEARRMSISRWDKGRSCDMAVLVSYAHAGRPKVVEMDTARPVIQPRSASLIQIPVTAANRLRKADESQRLSLRLPPVNRMPSSPISPSRSLAADIETRRPSTSHSPVTTSKLTTFPDSASFASSFQTASSRSYSPAPSEVPRRPSSSTAGEPVSSARSSIYAPTKSRLDLARINTTQSAYPASNRQSYLAPLTPQSPALSFLSSDPYENSTISAASPIIKKPAAHRRLRSISMKLSLAKIAISPAKKPYDARINGRAPPTPVTPMTPQTAPLDGGASFPNPGPNKIRRASTILRPKSRGGESKRAPTPESAPPVPQMAASTMQQKRSTTMGRMLPRGANEREPTLIIPPCPESDAASTSSMKSRAIRRRKSLMDFMDSL